MDSNQLTSLNHKEQGAVSLVLKLSDGSILISPEFAPVLIPGLSQVKTPQPLNKTPTLVSDNVQSFPVDVDDAPKPYDHYEACQHQKRRRAGNPDTSRRQDPDEDGEASQMDPDQRQGRITGQPRRR